MAGNSAAGDSVRHSPETGTYDAFISYSQRGDKAIAKAIRTVIQTVGKPWWRVRNLNVFLDATSLSAAPGLWQSIAGKLDHSRFLILLASPEAAASVWVDREVAHFIGVDGAGLDRVLIGLTDGALAWDSAAGDFVWNEATPLPPSLRCRFREEPLWADLRPFRADPARATKSDQAFLHAALDLAATIKGVEKAELYSDELRQQRRSLRLAYGGAAVVAALGVGAGIAAWVAVERAAEATRNFAIARETVDSVVSDIAHDLRDVEGMRVENMERILSAAQSALDRLYEIAPGDSSVRASRAAALMEMGDTYNAKGDSGTAVAVYEESLELRREQAAGKMDLNLAASVSEGLSRVGYARLKNGDVTGALEGFEESLAILTELTAAHPDRKDWSNRFAWDTMKKGDTLAAAGRVTDALAALTRSATLWRSLVASSPRDPVWRDNLGWALTKIGQTSQKLGDRPAATAAFDEALALRRALYDEDKGSVRAEDNVAYVLVEIAGLHQAGGDTEGAEAALIQAETLRRHVVAVDPGNAEWRNGLAATLIRLGIVERGQGAPEVALGHFEEAESIFRILARNDPENLLWRQNLAGVLYRLGHIRLAAGSGAAAIADFRESEQLRRAIVTDADSANEVRDDLAASLVALGDGLRRVDGLAAARASYEEALAIQRDLVAADPVNRTLVLGLAESAQRMGEVQLADKDFAAAAAAFEEARSQRARLVEIDPRNVEWAGWLAASYADLGDVAVARKDDGAALGLFEQSLAIRRDVVARAPDSEWLRRDLAFNLEKLAGTRRRLGDGEGAIADYRESIALRETFTDNMNLDRVRDLARARWNLQTLIEDRGERIVLLSDLVGALTELDDATGLSSEDARWLEQGRSALSALLDADENETPADLSAGDLGLAPDGRD